MVKRKLKLAQIICAVYSLNKPCGASKKEIIRFCKLRYNCYCNSRDIGRVLERALDEGLLVSFRKRYCVAKLRSGILWVRGDCGGLRKKGGGRRKKSRRAKTGIKVKRNYNTTKKKFPRDSLKLQKKNVKSCSSLYKLWKRELTLEIDNMKKLTKYISGRSLCKKRKGDRTKGKHNRFNKQRSKSQTVIKGRRHNTQGKTKTSNNNKKGKRMKQKRIKNKNALRSRRDHKRASAKSIRKQSGKKKDSQNISRNSKASKESVNEGDSSDFHRLLLRQTRHALVHGKSWDHFNFDRQRRTRENQQLVKRSQLVQKILTQRHAASWDDLNLKLQQMKEVASCSGQEAKADGDGVVQNTA